MQRVLTNSQMRSADEYTINTTGISSEILMRRAGEAIAEEVIKAVKQDKKTSILAVCGTGNNGGDGYVCANLLLSSGYRVKVFALEGNLSPDCAREKAAYKGEYSEEIKAEVIIDCIFGTGLARKVCGIYEDVISKINGSGAFIVSADIPSGLNGENGLVLGCAVKADTTVAIAELKIGAVLGDGADYCGNIVVKDIGIVCPSVNYPNIFSDADISKFYPARRRNSHKGTYGSACIVAGSDRYIGAAVLASETALKSGCGYVKLTTSQSVKSCMATKYPQVIFTDEPDMTSSAIAIGMGCGVSDGLYSLLKKLLSEYRGTLIIDADGLNTLAKFGADVLHKKQCAVVLTPHVKEFSRLTGLGVDRITANVKNIAEDFAKNYGVILLLKGASSIITDGYKTVINTRGTTALSKGGSGDMLSGYMCGSAARGLNPFDAAICAAYTLGLSAEISSLQKTDYCVTAKDIIKNLHFAVKQLTDLT